MKTQTEDIENQDGLILVRIPHQMPANAYAFESREEALCRITSHHVGEGYTWWRYTEAEWSAYIEEQFGADWSFDDEAVALFEQGARLFAKGAAAIIDRSGGISNKSELVDEADAGEELDFAMDCVRSDLHAAYLLTREKALEILNGAAWGTHHQRDRWMRKLRKEAEFLGWIKPAE